MKILFVKSQVAGYARKNGVVVKPHSDRRVAAAAGGMFVTMGNKKFEVDSLEDAAKKWTGYRDRTGAGMSEIGNGLEIHDEAGQVLGRVSYNGRIWNPDGTERAKVSGPQRPVVFHK